MAILMPAPNSVNSLVLSVHKKCVGGLVGPSDSSPELVELAEPHPFRTVHDERVRIGYVEARLDDRRRDQHVDLAVHKVHHDVFQLALVHLPVGILDARVREQAP